MLTTNNSAKFAFFYMLSLVALVFMALAAGMIIFQIINSSITDELSLAPGGFSQNILKFAISAIIIAAPIYFVIVWLINKNLMSGRLELESGVRKWLTYFILLVSAVVMISWLIATINSFLNGELTVKFILKALTAILIAALIFSYYLYDIRRAEVNKVNNIIRIYFYGSMGLAAVALIVSFFFIDSPLKVREQKFDQLIINKFSQLDGVINGYYGDNKKLPENLDSLLNNGSSYYLTENDLVDPATSKRFDYNIKGKDVYELCATFKTSSKDLSKNRDYYFDARWTHEAGYQCLKQRVMILDRDKLDWVKPAPAR